MPIDYRPRIVDEQVERMLDAVGGILLEGPRACGKTATGEAHASSSIRLDIDEDALELARIDPTTVLDGETPRLIDEWQLEPRIWNRIRRAIDDRQAAGQFILAGSAMPADDITRHSGAGRITRIRMRPMTLLESGQSNGKVSLAALAEGDRIGAAQSALEMADVVERLCVGGWPGLQHASAQDAQEVLSSYLDDVARIDLARLDGARRHDPARVRRLLVSLARNTATEASVAALARDTGGAGDAIDVDTVREYLSALERLMVIEDQPSWAPHLRSRDVVRKAAKRHFTDPSLAAAALRASPQRVLRDPNTLGLLFESLAVRDLRVYAQSLGAHVSHYRDSAGREVDAIIELPDGGWVAVEIKLGTNHADAAAASLDAFVSRIDTSRTGAPRARVVVTAIGGYAYTREDGVVVVPIGALGP
jgi:uncharacterized protein